MSMSCTLTRARLGAIVGGRHREQERIVEQPDALDLGVVDRQRQHDDVERAAVQLLEQHCVCVSRNSTRRSG